MNSYTILGYRHKEVIRMTTSNLNNQSDKEIKQEEIPISLKSEKYNKVTIAANEEGRKTAKDPTATGFRSIEKLKKEL